jgi:hypothetical protein
LTTPSLLTARATTPVYSVYSLYSCKVQVLTLLFYRTALNKDKLDYAFAPNAKVLNSLALLALLALLVQKYNYCNDSMNKDKLD